MTPVPNYHGNLGDPETLTVQAVCMRLVTPTNQTEPDDQTGVNGG